MAKKKHISAPADRLNGTIIEKDGKLYLDTGIGLLLEMNTDASRIAQYAEADIEDCDHKRWTAHYGFLQDTLEACDELSRRISSKESISIRIRNENIVKEYQSSGQIPQEKNLKVESDDFPFNFTIGKDSLSPEDKHKLFNGEAIEAICCFNNFSWLKTNIHRPITLTPRTVEKAQMPQAGDICQGYIVNCHEQNGIYVYWQGWTGLILKQHLPDTFAEECRNGTICSKYPAGGLIEVRIESITYKEDKVHISMIPTAHSYSVNALATGKESELRISSIDTEKGIIYISWQGKDIKGYVAKEDVRLFRNRIWNGVYKVNDKIKGRVRVWNGIPSFLVSMYAEQSGINIGDIVQCKVDYSVITVPGNDGSEQRFFIKDGEGMIPSIVSICKSNNVITEARCCEITAHGDPLFSIKSRMAELEEQIIDQRITAEVIDASGNYIIWKYGSLIQSIPIQSATRTYAPGDRIIISSARKRRRIEYEIDESNASWDGVDLKAGDIIPVRILAAPAGRHYSIAYGDCIGTLMADTKFGKGKEINVKVVYFNPEEKRLDCIEAGADYGITEKTAGAEVHILSHISRQYLWVRYDNSIYLMKLENDYPSHIRKFLMPKDSDVTLEISPEGNHILKAVHGYDHSGIASLGVSTGSEICARIIGETEDGFILSFKGIYCVMPFDQVDWNSHLFVDRETYRIGKDVMAKVIDKTEDGLYISHKDMIDDPWEAADIKVGQELSCRILHNREDGAAIVRSDSLIGIIGKDDLSWFTFIETDRFAPGTIISAEVAEIDAASRTLRLRSNGKDNPWDLDFGTGDKVKAKVIEVFSSSITVRTDNGLEGSMKLDDLTILPYKECTDIVKAGDVFDAEISGRDSNGRTVTFRKSGIDDISQRGRMHLGQIIENAKIICISKGDVYLDLGDNICGIMPNALIHEMLDGYKAGSPLENIITPGQTMDVKICRLIQEENQTYVTGTDGSVFDHIDTCQMTGIIESMKDDHMTVRFRYNGYDHIARIDYRGLHCAHDYIRHKAGDEMTFALTGLNKKNWRYTGNTTGLGQNPWTGTGHPQQGDIFDAEVIGIGRYGEAVLSLGKITCALTGTWLLTDTPWIRCKNSVHGLNAGDRIKVIVTEYDAGKRHIQAIPYPSRLQTDIETGNLTVRHVTGNGLYAYCDIYDCCCFVPKDELYWCPIDKVGKLFEAGDTFAGRLIRFDYNQGMPVMSRKRPIAHADSSVAVGDIVEGNVRKVTSDAVVLHFGTYDNVVKLKNLTWDPVEALGEDYIERTFKIGDTVQAKVTARNEDDVTMSVKEAAFNPWTYCSLEGKTVQAKITVKGEGWVVAEYGTVFKTVIRNWPQELDPKTGDVAAVKFHNLNRKMGHIQGMLINILPDEFRSNVVPDSNIRCHVTGVTDSAVEIRTAEGGWPGFIPAEEWSWDNDDTISESCIGSEITAKITDINYAELTVKLSRRRAEGLPAEMCPISVGETAEVIIKDVHAGTGKDSLYVFCPELPYLKGSVPYKELGWRKSEMDASGYRPDDRIRVQVTGIDYKNICFKASIRKLTDDTRELADIMLNEKLEVTVVRFIPQKFYAEVTYGKHHGILYLDEEYWSCIEGFSNFFAVGKEVEAEYRGLEGNRMRFFLPEGEYSFNWDETITVGDTIEVKVIRVLTSGIMVWYKGLVIKINRTDLSWSPKTLDIEQEFEIDEIIEVLVDEFDVENRKIRLNRKNLLPNPMEILKGCLTEGSTIPMVIRKISENGIIGEYQGATCRLPYNETVILIQKKHIEGTPVDVIIESVDDHYINVRLSEETVRKSEELVIGYGYWGKVLSIDGYELSLDVKGYQAKALIDPLSLSGSTIESIYKTGKRYWFIIESIDAATSCLVMTTVRPEAKDEWFMRQNEGTGLDGDIVKVTNKKITVFAKGMYFDFDKDQISRFYLPNAKILYSEGQVIRLTLVSKSPLEVRVTDSSLNFEEAGLKVGDPVEGKVVFFMAQDKTVFIKDDRGFIYTMKLGDYFRQPYVQIFFHNADTHIRDLKIKGIDQQGKRVFVGYDQSESITDQIYDSIKDGDIISAVVEGSHGYKGYILKYEDWHLLLSEKDVPEGKKYAEGDTLYVRVIRISRADNTAFVSLKHLKRDPITRLQPGKQVNIEYLDIINQATGECRIRVDGKFDYLCIPDSSVSGRTSGADTVFIQKTDVTGRVVYISHDAPDLSKPLPGELVEFCINSFDSTAKKYKVKVTRKHKLFNGTMDNDAMLWYSVFHPFLIGFRGDAVITENRGGHLSVNARCITADPLIYLEGKENFNATVIGHDKKIGYLVAFDSSMGVVSDKELMWQTCELKGLYWKHGQTVVVCPMEANRHGTLYCSHKRSYENPLLTHSVKVNDTYSATVRRTNNHHAPSVVVEIGNTGIEAIIDANSSRQFFSSGTEIELPDPGKVIRKIRIADIQQLSPEYKWTQRIIAVIESVD